MNSCVPSRPCQRRWLVVGLAWAAGVAGAHGASPLSPAQALGSLRLADPGLVVEAVAAEPDVVSPVAMAWDHRGRLFVAEMRDYPSAATGGAVRLLEDRDGDGRMDSSVVFAEGLAFPNSVLPWHDGVIVTAAPDVVFLRDADGDGRADERHVVFTGLGTGNQQLRANGLAWDLEGWVVAANGRSDGSVRPVEARASGGWTRLDAPAQPIRGRDLRLDPRSGAIQTLAGRSQFGLGLDDWGNRFLSWNTIPARHEVFPDAFLDRNPATAGANVLVDTLPAGDAGEVHPLSPAPRVFNNESASHFNALSGLHVFRGDGLGAAYHGNLFVGESLRNLVHRRAIEPRDVTFHAVRRDPPGREFLASTDPWFHPVGFSTGPDGCLYVADFYREFVEHPDWVAKDMRGRVEWSRGREHGRIWRVRAMGGVRTAARSFAGATLADCARRLDSGNAWERETAHRLLLEQGAAAASPTLAAVVAGGSHPESRVRALHVLHQTGGVPPSLLAAASADPHPRVRQHVAQVAGLGLAISRARADSARETTRPSSRPVGDVLARLAMDSDDRVRLAAVLSMGSMEDAPRREELLARVAAATTNAWLRLAAASSSALARREWLPPAPTPAMVRTTPPRPPTVAADRARVVEEFRPALEMKGDPRRGAAWVRQACLACHVLHGHGQRVGPDLVGVSGKDPAALLVEILDPSRVVTPDHVAHELRMKDGRSWTGLVASETSTRITLRFPGAPDMSVAKADVAELRSTGRSLMPDGLEDGWTREDVAGLVAYLRAPDPALLQQQRPKP